LKDDFETRKKETSVRFLVAVTPSNWLKGWKWKSCQYYRTLGPESVNTA